MGGLKKINTDGELEMEIGEDLTSDCDVEQATVVCDSYSEDGVSAYLKEIRGFKILTKDEVQQLVNEMRTGKIEAKNKIISHNLKLAFHVAKKYSGRGVALLDLVQEANLGLVKAVEKFEPEMGYAFSTYALWWTTATVRRYLQEYGGNIKIPTYINERIGKVDKITKAIEANGKTATAEEIAITLDMPLEDIKHTIRSKKISSVLSLDFSHDEFDPLSNIVSDAGQDVEGAFIKDESTKLLIDVVKKACKNERESDIILRSFGFYGDKNTLEEIGQIYGITKERVRQIKEKALKRFQSILNCDTKDKTTELRESFIALRD